jgi:glycerol-3-phosphate dehydrogenase
MREEFAATLADIVFRRMMIGLDGDMGRELYREVSALAAAEAGWDPQAENRQLTRLRDYAGSMRVEQVYE